MTAQPIKELLRQTPFEPIELALSDGRLVLIRHPDQAVVSERNLILGLAHLRRTKPISTPASGDVVAKDWLMTNMLHVVSAEPANGNASPRRRRKR